VGGAVAIVALVVASVVGMAAAETEEEKVDSRVKTRAAREVAAEKKEAWLAREARVARWVVLTAPLVSLTSIAVRTM
jgi:hypothetical protein